MLTQLLRIGGRFSLAVAACTFMVSVSGGCSMFPKSGKDAIVDESVALQGSESAEAFQRIRQAKAQNAIVLQVTGDSEPIRVLPLPPDGRSVFVSDLLRQTGIQEKLGRMHVTVYRSSPVDFMGAKMEVRFDEEGEVIRPETDYALQAGDRIRIAKDTTTRLNKLFDQIIPPNGSKAITGR